MLRLEIMNLFAKIILCSACLLVPIQVFADIPNFDIIKFTNGDKSLFIRIWSSGILKNHDLCYYKWGGEYLGEVEDFLQHLTQEDSIEVYDELVKINMANFGKDYIGSRDTILYILKGLQKMSIDSLQSRYIIEDAVNANTAGYTYTTELSYNDNIWLSDYPIEKIFNITDYELCEMSLYAIKYNVSEPRKKSLRIELDKLLKAHDRVSFEKEISELYKENIIMIGFCSC